MDFQESFAAQLRAKAAATPNTGVNLCEIDDFVLPPDNLVVLGNFADLAAARAGARHYPSIDKLLLISADGSTESL